MRMIGNKKTKIFILLAAIFLFLISSGCVQAPPFQNPSPPQGTAGMFKLDADSIVSTQFAGMWDWVAPSGLALMVSAVLLALFYIFGTLLRNQMVINFVKQELLELVISGFLAVIILGSIAVLANIDMGSSLPEDFFPKATPLGSGFTGVVAGDSVYKVAGAFFELGGYYVGSWLDMSYLLNVIVDQFASVTPYARPLGVGLVATPFAGFFSPIKQLLYNMSVALSVAYIIMYAQLFVYLFSLQAFLHYYLPAGIFLRCFTPTRRVGGTLIGISAAFLLVFPLLTVLTFSVMLSGLGNPLVNWTDFLRNFFSDLTPGGFMKHASDFFSKGFGNGGITDIVSGTYGGVGSILQSIVGDTFTIIIMIPISVVALAFLFAFLAPALNVLVFIEAARRFSAIFGEEVDISSLTRMI
ncbi:hypothetical protein HY988_00765 [Candidatus Micrarchaeota archaeon]|nr:hypothetical protein [Candidatus Micrarchaeota archaeon]